MTDNTGIPAASPFDALRRYVPLAVWLIVLLVLLAIPLRIIGFGYLPTDDSLRHAAKAVSGKPWSDILVLGPAFQDQNFVWHDLLRQIFLATHCSTDALVVFAVVALFILVALSPLPWLKRPEAWLITLTIVSITSVNFTRMFLGRPFLLTQFVLMTILCAWQFRGNVPARFRTFAGLGLLIALCTLVHGTWYLWVVPIAAFFSRANLAGASGWGSRGWRDHFLGAIFTGHPIGSLLYAFEIGLRTVNLGANSPEAMVSELRPFSGDFLGLIVLGGLLILRRLGGINPRPWKTSAVFWLVCICWVLGFKAYRFWADWGWPALMILVVSDLQLILEARLSFDSPKRLALAFGLAIMTFLATTNNSGSSGWTQNVGAGYLTQDNPTSKAGCRTRAAFFIPPTSCSSSRRFSKTPPRTGNTSRGLSPR